MLNLGVGGYFLAVEPIKKRNDHLNFYNVLYIAYNR